VSHAIHADDHHAGFFADARRLSVPRRPPVSR
jgi:hypothetical protein